MCFKPSEWKPLLQGSSTWQNIQTWSSLNLTYGCELLDNHRGQQTRTWEHVYNKRPVSAAWREIFDQVYWVFSIIPQVWVLCKRCWGLPGKMGTGSVLMNIVESLVTTGETGQVYIYLSVQTCYCHNGSPFLFRKLACLLFQVTGSGDWPASVMKTKSIWPRHCSRTTQTVVRTWPRMSWILASTMSTRNSKTGSNWTFDQVLTESEESSTTITTATALTWPES